MVWRNGLFAKRRAITPIDGPASRSQRQPGQTPGAVLATAERPVGFERDGVATLADHGHHRTITVRCIGHRVDRDRLAQGLVASITVDQTGRENQRTARERDVIVVAYGLADGFAGRAARLLHICVGPPMRDRMHRHRKDEFVAGHPDALDAQIAADALRRERRVAHRQRHGICPGGHAQPQRECERGRGIELDA